MTDIILKTLSELRLNGSSMEEKEFEVFKKNILAQIRNFEDVLKKIDNHHENTFRHSVMVAHDVEYIATKLGLKKETIDSLRIASLLHDVGKLYIHSVVLDLGGRADLEKIWNYINPGKKAPDGNLMLHLTVKDVIRYKAKFESENWFAYMRNYLQWMKDNDVKNFLNLPLRQYLEYHQEGTRLILEQMKLDPKIVQIAATHHPSYFSDDKKKDLPKECRIIEIADKFNALVQSEGFRSYFNKKTRAEALMIIINELKKDYANGFFKGYEKNIIKALFEKYVADEIRSDLVTKAKIYIKNQTLHQKKYLPEIERIIVLLSIALSLSKEFDDIITYDQKNFLNFLEQKLKELEILIMEHDENSLAA